MWDFYVMEDARELKGPIQRLGEAYEEVGGR
jgi:hypothetical protein